jgi:hypothetical protein
MCRPFLLLLAFVLSAGRLLSADGLLIDPSDAPNYNKQNVTVSGLVTNVFVSKHGNAFINFGDKYPNQTFTGWIPAGTPLATDPSLHLLQGKNVKIPGQSSFTTESLRSKSHRRLRSFRNSSTKMKTVLLLATMALASAHAQELEDHHAPDKLAYIKIVEQQMGITFLSEVISMNGQHVRWDFDGGNYHGIPIKIDMTAFPSTDEASTACTAAYHEARAIYNWLNAKKKSLTEY